MARALDQASYLVTGLEYIHVSTDCQIVALSQKFICLMAYPPFNFWEGQVLGAQGNHIHLNFARQQSCKHGNSALFSYLLSRQKLHYVSALNCVLFPGLGIYTVAI